VSFQCYVQVSSLGPVKYLLQPVDGNICILLVFVSMSVQGNDVVLDVLVVLHFSFLAGKRQWETLLVCHPLRNMWVFCYVVLCECKLSVTLREGV
jgi:hypothetical protein